MTQNIETIARPLIAVLENYKGLSDSIQASIQAYNEVFKPIREEIANFSSKSKQLRIIERIISHLNFFLSKSSITIVSQIDANFKINDTAI